MDITEDFFTKMIRDTIIEKEEFRINFQHKEFLSKYNLDKSVVWLF